MNDWFEYLNVLVVTKRAEKKNVYKKVDIFFIKMQLKILVNKFFLTIFCILTAIGRFPMTRIPTSVT